MTPPRIQLATASGRAAMRMSPRQVSYHLRRKARNVLARRLPRAYARRIERIARQLPPLRPDLRADGPHRAIAQLVSPFYLPEYLPAMDDAARGAFTFFGNSVDFGSPSSVDWHHRIQVESDFHLWRMKLGHMGVVCPMLVHGEARHIAAVAELLTSYRRQSSFATPGCFSSYWFPYSVSHRILAILSGYVLARGSRDLPEALREEIETFVHWNAGFVLDNVEHELKNNHLERNLAALCFYLSCVEVVPARLVRRLEREVPRAIEACVLPDGMMAERSAMYQGLTVMALGVFANTPFLSDSTRQLASDRRKAAMRAWVTMTHPDGDIALFNDSWFGEVPRPAHIAKDTRPVALLPNAGYGRLESKDTLVLMDAGAIGPRWNPGHGHADFLSVEVDLMGRRFLVDPGTFQYSTGPRRMYERSSQSHNGPARTGLEPVEYFGCFRVGRMREATFTAFDATASGGTMSGELELPDGTRVSRKVHVASGQAHFVDEWAGRTTGARTRLTVPDDWTLTSQTTDRLEFTDAEGSAELVITRGRVASIDTGVWSCRYLESRGATVIDLEPAAATSTAQVAWEVRAQRPSAAPTDAPRLAETDTP